MKRIIATILIAFSTYAHADYYDGNDLLEMANNKDSVTQFIFLGYVAGVQDVLNGEHFCVPSNVNLNQSKEITLKYIKANPKQWHLAGKNIILLALSDAFPCQ